jgi:hypothetical protein
VHKTAFHFELSRLGTLLIIILLTFFTYVTPGLAATPTPPPSATSDPQQLRRDILSDPNLQQREPTTIPQQMPDLPSVDLSFLRWVFIGAGTLITVILIVLLGPLPYRYIVKLRRLREPATLADGEEIATSDEAIQRAQDASALQDYRQALRLLYLAALLKLDEIGALRYDHALTNREYVRQVILSPALADALRPVVETFDDVWYGYRPLTPEGYATFEHKVGELMKAAESVI